MWDLADEGAIIMIIEIEGYGKEVLLTGKKCSVGKLKWMVHQTICLADKDTHHFVALFCRMHHFDKIGFEDGIMADYVIDVDTGVVFTPFVCRHR